MGIDLVGKEKLSDGQKSERIRAWNMVNTLAFKHSF